MRLFIASFFEQRFIEALEDIVSYARANAGRNTVKWVERSNFHLTYAFLGDLSGSGVAQAVNSVDAALEECRAFTLSLGAFGAFPSRKNPRVLWLGLGEGIQPARDIAGKLAQALSARGLVFENRFEPHITLGRVKSPLPDKFFARVADYALCKTAVSALVSVEVMESVSAPDGSRPFGSPTRAMDLCPASRSSVLGPKGRDGPLYKQIYSRRLRAL